MIRLNSTRKLQAVLAGAVAATQPSFTLGYSEHVAAGGTYLGEVESGALNSTSDVDLLAAPASGSIRDIDLLLIHNRDSAAVNVTVKYDVSGTDTILISVNLETLETLEYTHGSGWKVLTADGEVKGAGSGGGGSSGAYVTLTDTATEDQDVITGLSYTPGSVDVYVNGVRLLPSDYTATNGSSITLDEPMAENDEWTVVAWTVTGAVGSIPLAEMEAAGDLIVGTGVATADNLSVGDDGQILVVDSSQPTGLAWRLEAPHGQCRFNYVSTSVTRLVRFNGKYLTINGVPYEIPSAGVDLSNASLASNDTTYYVYAYMSGGTMTLEASATAPTADTATGVAVKTGDATRTLVGMVRKTGGNFYDEGSKRFTLSWFNRMQIVAQKIAAAEYTPNTGSYAEISTDLRVEFLCWADNVTYFTTECPYHNGSAGNNLFVYPAIDSALNYGAINVATAPATGYYHTIPASGSGVLAVGYHYCSPYASAGGGTPKAFAAAVGGTFVRLMG